MDSVIMNGYWSGLEKSVSTFKTPTHLLLNEKREFEAFGYEAEKRYTELYQQGRHQRCYFFRRFKTKLTNQVANTCSFKVCIWLRKFCAQHMLYGRKK